MMTNRSTRWSWCTDALTETAGSGLDGAAAFCCAVASALRAAIAPLVQPSAPLPSPMLGGPPTRSLPHRKHGGVEPHLHAGRLLPVRQRRHPPVEIGRQAGRAEANASESARPNEAGPNRTPP
jgi:hypothetical protein